MGKFSKEEKLMAVKRYLAGEDSFKRIRDSMGADDGDLRSWSNMFDFAPNPPPTYSQSYSTLTPYSPKGRI